MTIKRYVRLEFLSDIDIKTTSLQRLRRKSISNLLNYIRLCHPKVDTVLNNVSVLLATLLT